MEVYQIHQDDMTRIDEADVEYEENLENRLVRTQAAEIGGVEILYIGQQGTTEQGKQYDLVGVDEEGNLVIVELKRGKAPRKVIAQGLDYASRLRYQEYDELEDEYEEFLRKQGYSGAETLQEAHQLHFDLEDPLSEDEFNDDQRIVIVGGSLDDAITNMADYLRERGELDVVLVQYQIYQDEERDLELLTTNAIRRPLEDEPAAKSDKSLSERQKRRKEFWEEFQTRHREHDLPGSGVRKSASYAVYVFTSGRRNRPAYIRPKVEYGGAFNAIRFYGDAREIVVDETLRNEFEGTVRGAASEIGVNLSPNRSEKPDFDWDVDETRDFDLLTITHGDSDHDAFQNKEKVEEIQQWLLDTTLVFEQALEEFEREGNISV